MTSRAEPKVLTAGQICIGERAWSAAKWVVADLPRTLWYLSCLSWKTFFVAPTAPSRTVGLARYLYDERDGTESTLATCNLDRFARRKWDLGARAALPWSPEG
jgi:hypothetical protein